MNEEFGFGGDTETLREYVIPYALKEDRDAVFILQNLQNYGYSVASGVSAIVINFLSQNKLKKAAELGNCYYTLFKILNIHKSDQFCKNYVGKKYHKKSGRPNFPS